MKKTPVEEKLIELIKEKKILSIRDLSGEDTHTAEQLVQRGILQKISTSLNSYYYVIKITGSCPGKLAVLALHYFTSL